MIFSDFQYLNCHLSFEAIRWRVHIQKERVCYAGLCPMVAVALINAVFGADNLFVF